jgi:regulator of ribonuclease activity A
VSKKYWKQRQQQQQQQQKQQQKQQLSIMTMVPDTGRVLVVDGGGSYRCALLGDMIATAAVQNNWNGIIVYGFIRDIDILKTLPIGMSAIGKTPKKSIRNNQGEINVPISFGNISINSNGNDFVFADNDGIVFMKKQGVIINE